MFLILRVARCGRLAPSIIIPVATGLVDPSYFRPKKTYHPRKMQVFIVTDSSLLCNLRTVGSHNSQRRTDCSGGR